jgi:outer membrane immunogenic protein
MKRMTALCALALALSTGAVCAADLPSIKDTSGDLLAAPVKGTSWTSIYVGVDGGYSNANHSVNADGSTVTDNTTTDTANAFIDGLNSSGAVYGINGGADLQRGKFVFGVFGDYNFSNADMTTGASVNGNSMFSASIKDGDSWMGGVRVGYLVDDRALLYVLGGYGQQDEKYTLTGVGSKDATKDVTFSGWIVGAGSEFAVTQNVAFGIEYQHFFGGTETLYAGKITGFDNLAVTDSLDKDTVMATLKVKLNGSVFGR